MKRRLLCAIALVLLADTWPGGASAQSILAPAASSATPTSTEPAADTPHSTGVVAKIKFDLSDSSQGAFGQLVPELGYDFPRWGLRVGVPLDASSAASSPAAARHYGIGDAYLSVHYTVSADRFGFSSKVGGTAPSGNATLGLGTGQSTWTWTNSLDYDFAWVAPFVDAGVGNSVNSATSISIDLRTARGARSGRTLTMPTQPYTTTGKIAHADLGVDLTMGAAVGISLLAYDTAPWGNQTAVSRVVPVTRPAGPRQRSRSAKDQRFFEVNAVTQGPASLTRDYGVGGSVFIDPTRYLDVSLNYSHSVPLQLDIVSMRVTTDLVKLFRKPSLDTSGH